MSWGGSMSCGYDLVNSDGSDAESELRREKKTKQSASARRGKEARKITANVKETTMQTLKKVRAGKYT